MRDVLHRNTQPVYSDSQYRTLASGFSQFFVDKLSRIHQSIAAKLASTTAPGNRLRRHSGPTLTQLPSTLLDEVLKLLKSSCLKPSPVDVLPSSLLRSSADVLAPVIEPMANLSLTDCWVPAAFKTAQVRPLLKQPGLDKDQMSNYRPISKLPTVSKVSERLVLDRLRPHLLSSPRPFHRDCAVAYHEQCIHRR